jgi:hypothetical protein
LESQSKRVRGGQYRENKNVIDEAVNTTHFKKMEIVKNNGLNDHCNKFTDCIVVGTDFNFWLNEEEYIYDQMYNSDE